MKSFIQYLSESRRGEEISREKMRHSRAVKIKRHEREKEERRTGRTRTKDDDKFIRARHKTARKVEQQRHRRELRASYIPDYSEELDETQMGSRQSSVGSGTHSSLLKYITTSKRKGWSDRGRSSRKEKKRASKERRQAGKKQQDLDMGEAISSKFGSAARKVGEADPRLKRAGEAHPLVRTVGGEAAKARRLGSGKKTPTSLISKARSMQRQQQMKPKR